MMLCCPVIPGHRCQCSDFIFILNYLNGCPFFCHSMFNLVHNKAEEEFVVVNDCNVISLGPYYF